MQQTPEIARKPRVKYLVVPESFDPSPYLPDWVRFVMDSELSNHSGLIRFGQVAITDGNKVKAVYGRLMVQEALKKAPLTFRHAAFFAENPGFIPSQWDTEKIYVFAGTLLLDDKGRWTVPYLIFGGDGRWRMDFDLVDSVFDSSSVLVCETGGQ